MLFFYDIDTLGTRVVRNCLHVPGSWTRWGKVRPGCRHELLYYMKLSCYFHAQTHVMHKPTHKHAHTLKHARCFWQGVPRPVARHRRRRQNDGAARQNERRREARAHGGLRMFLYAVVLCVVCVLCVW